MRGRGRIRLVPLSGNVIVLCIVRDINSHLDPAKGSPMFIFSWIYELAGTEHEALRIKAGSRDELLAGIISAMRKRQIKASHEMRVVQCPAGEDIGALIDDVEAAMQQVAPKAE
jgi:hypothetical protein